MKKLFSLTRLIIFLLALSTVSCEKTDEELLVGKWEGVSERTIDYEDSEIVKDSTYTYESDEFVLEIFADGTCKSFEYGVLDKTWDWEIDGDIFSLIEGYNSRGAKYTINEDTLTMDFTSEWDEEGVEYKRVFYYIFKRI